MPGRVTSVEPKRTASCRTVAARRNTPLKPFRGAAPWAAPVRTYALRAILQPDSGKALSYHERRPAARRAFAVLDPGGRSRTGISPMDSGMLYPLSYPGAVTWV